MQQKPEKVCDNILQMLFPSNKTAFVDPVWERRKKEIAQLFKQDNKAQGADTFEKYKAAANLLREQYGYGKEAVPKKDDQIDSNAQNEGQQKDAVDFVEEIAKLAANFEFKNANSESAVAQMNKAFVMHHQQLIHLCSLILKEDLPGPVNDLFDLPFISESKCKFDILLAMLIQNAYHAKNGDRVSAVESKTYVELLDGKVAYNYLVEALSGKLKQQLLSLESELVKQYQSDASDILSEQILTAPDQFYAAAMMKSNKLFFGNGDFKKCLQVLQTQRRADFLDIGNKLVLLKTGHLYHKSKQVDINDAGENPGIKLYKAEQMPEGERTAIFADKSFDSSPENRAVSLKHVFKLWSRQVYQADANCNLTQQQLENIFPEYRPRLRLYGACCDGSGKIVKNPEYYQWYRAQNHRVKGRRGGK